MIKTDVKKLLLAGTAIVAVGAFAVSPAYAVDEFVIDADDDGSFETGATDETADDGVTAGITGNAVQFRGNGATLNVEEGETIGNSAVHTNAIVASTLGNDATGDTLVIQNDENGATAAITIDGSIDDGDTDDFNLTFEAFNENVTDEDESLTVDVNGSINLGAGDLLLLSNDAQADSQANTVTVNVSGNITANGGITLDVDATGGQGAATDATLVLDGTTAAQTITGDIVAGDANEGRISVTNTNAGGVTFAGTIGQGGAANVIDSVVVNNDTNDQAVEFRGSVNAANGITLGGGADPDTVTATFNTTGGPITITGGIAGGAVNDTVALVANGGDTLTLDGAATDTNIDTLSITGDTTVTTNQDLTLTGDATVARGSTLTTTNNTITANAITNSGTVLLNGGDVTAAIANSNVIQFTNGGDTLTGNVTGSGTVDVDAAATIQGSVANNIDVADGVTLTIDGGTGNETLSGNVVINDAAGENEGLDIDAQGNVITVSGTISAAATGQGLVTIVDDGGTVAFTNDVGVSATNTIGTLDINGGVSANTVTTTGNLFVDTITADDGDTLQFLGTGAQAVSGTVTGGLIVVGDGGMTARPTVTFSDVVDVTPAFTVNDGATAIFVAAGNDSDGTLSADAATIQVNSTADVTFEDQNDADVITWNIGVTRTGAGVNTFGQVILANDAVDVSDDTIHFLVEEGSAPLAVGTLDDVFADANGANQDAVIAGATVTDNSFIYDFTLVNDTANDAIDVTVAFANDPSSAGATGNNNVAGELLLETLSGNTNTQINQLQGSLQAASTNEQYNERVEATLPTVDAGAVVAATSVTTQTTGITQTRLAALRSGTVAETGMAAGNMSNGLKAWIQGFGATGEQDKRDGVDGYEVDTYGFAAGIDSSAIADDWVFGLAFAYADTEVDSDNANNTKTEIDSYQVSLYGEYAYDDATYISGQLGYQWAENDTSRSNIGGVSTLNATGDFDSDQFFARIEAGRDYALNSYGSTVITPKLSAAYSNYEADSYNETGAGGASLNNVDTDEMNVFELGLAVDASWMVENADGSYLKPVLSAGVRHDLVGDEVETTAVFAGAPGNSFSTKGFDPAQTTFDLGASVTYFATSNWELTADYDFTVKSDYDAHSGSLKAAYKF